MKIHNQKLLAAAVASATVVLSGAASAVAINADGQGQALIYPYYTARNGQTSFISVVNTTTTGKAVKIRFREALNTEDVLDFNIYLSPEDVWTGAVVARNGGAVLLTSDTSCTVPPKSAWNNEGGGVFSVPFFNFDYNNTDGVTQSLDRTLEGYVEIIEMATIPSTSTIFTQIKHTNGTVPCANLPTTTTAPGVAGQTVPSGGLFGTVTRVSAGAGPNTGMSNSFPATAYVGFNRDGTIHAPEAKEPNFSDHGSCVAAVSDGTSTVVAQFGPAPSGPLCLSADQQRAFAAVNMARQIQGEWSWLADTDTVATDWVITMPNKQPFTTAGTGPAVPPFTTRWSPSLRTACEPVNIRLVSREEDTVAGPGVGFSPPPPQAPGNSLCAEVSVISFSDEKKSGPSAVLSSAAGGTQAAVPGSPLWLSTAGLPAARKSNGWATLTFTGANAVTGIVGTRIGGVNLATGVPLTGTNVTFTGLPVIAYGVTQFRVTQGSVNTPANNYAHSVPLTLRRSFTIQ